MRISNFHNINNLFSSWRPHIVISQKKLPSQELLKISECLMPLLLPWTALHAHSMLVISATAEAAAMLDLILAAA